LKDLIKQKGQFTLEETLEIIQPIAKALEYVHELGIIHRDLKPGNIIFLRDNPVITDFGIAKNVKDTINTITDETGRLVGSIPYMSPERIDEKPFDHRADIYALGVLSYEMLTGTNPFAANTHTGAMKKVTTYQPPLISNEVPNIPREFANLLNNLINKESNRRPENLRELIEFDLLKIQITQIREQFEKERQRENTDRKRRERDEKARTRNQENTNVEWVIKEREIDAKRLYEIERKKQLAEESVQKESKKKGTFTLVIVIVVVLIFALSIFVFGTNKDNSETALEKLLDGYSLISESGENPNKSLALDAFYVFDDAQRKATETLLDEPSNNLAKVILILADYFIVKIRVDNITTWERPFIDDSVLLLTEGRNLVDSITDSEYLSVVPKQIADREWQSINQVKTKYDVLIGEFERITCTDISIN
ncbi:MAG: protein kinase, partial [bacterium]